MILPFRRSNYRDPSQGNFPHGEIPLPYSWVLTARLAIGPIPRSPLHWQQLQEAGFRSRFSCCYPEEEAHQAPADWPSARISLPDHRGQEPMRPEQLELAISSTRALIDAHAPVYLHCWAGKERSALVAVGIMAQEKVGDVFEALEWVRRCHPAASPIYDHLEILESIMKKQFR